MKFYIGVYIIAKRKYRIRQETIWVDSITGEEVLQKYTFNPKTGNLCGTITKETPFKSFVYWDNEKLEDFNLDEDEFTSVILDNENEILLLNTQFSEFTLNLSGEWVVIDQIPEFNLAKFKNQYSNYLKFFEEESDGIEIKTGFLNYRL